MEELLDLYGVFSLEDLAKLLKNNDPRVKDLQEFLTYYFEQEEKTNGK